MVLYRLLADLIVVVHATFVGFVVVGQFAVLYGLAWRRSWARNPWFRWLHLAAIAFVFLLSWTGNACPLTILENDLRGRAGQAAYPGDFIAYWVGKLLYYDLPPWVFLCAYSLFAAVVLLTFVLAPPRWPRRDRRLRDP